LGAVEKVVRRKVAMEQKLTEWRENNKMNREQPKRKINVILKIGLLLLGFGTGPILLLVLIEAMGINTNSGGAVGLGLLHVITFWPAVVFVVLVLCNINY